MQLKQVLMSNAKKACRQLQVHVGVKCTDMHQPNLYMVQVVMFAYSNCRYKDEKVDLQLENELAISV